MCASLFCGPGSPAITLSLHPQVLSYGEERLQGPPLPQLDARLLCHSLLLPALQKPRALTLPPVCKHLLLRHERKYASRPTFLLLFSRDIEILALFVSCMCHDLDHRGTNNSFQVASVRARITPFIFRLVDACPLSNTSFSVSLSAICAGRALQLRGICDGSNLTAALPTSDTWKTVS